MTQCTITRQTKYINSLLLPVYHIKNIRFAVDTPTRTPPEREIVCVTLKKDPKLGFGEFISSDLAERDKIPGITTTATTSDSLVKVFIFSAPVSGFVIVGEDNTGKLDLGIFIASIVPDGPAEKDGRIKPGAKFKRCRLKL